MKQSHAKGRSPITLFDFWETGRPWLLFWYFSSDTQWSQPPVTTATQSSTQGPHSGWKLFEVKIWTLFNNWSSVINHLKIFYKESHTRYFTKFLGFFCRCCFSNLSVQNRITTKKGQSKGNGPPCPSARGERTARSGRWMRGMDPARGRTTTWWGLLFLLFLNLKYILIFLYVSFLFIFSIEHLTTLQLHTRPHRTQQTSRLGTHHGCPPCHQHWA